MHCQKVSEVCNIGQIQKKGLGLFAKAKIEKGTKISDEVTTKIETSGYGFSAAAWDNADFWESFRTNGATSVEQSMSSLVASVRKERHCVGTHRYSMERHRDPGVVLYCTEVY
jgi:hypothetical protein